MPHYVINYKCYEVEGLGPFLNWAMDQTLGEPPDGHHRFSIVTFDDYLGIEHREVHTGPHDSYDMRNNTWHTDDECKRRKIHLRAYYTC